MSSKCDGLYGCVRGGMTPEMAYERERASGIRSTAMENHGREWEIYDDAKLVA